MKNAERKSIYVALIHYPVIDRHKKIITASVTNLDLHDIARSCRTFGIRKYFVVHPSPDEQALNARIVSHWHSGFGQKSHPTRTQALERIELVHDYAQVLENIEKLEGEKPLVVGTSARKTGQTRTPEDVKTLRTERPVLVLFGTGYGLAASWNEKIDLFMDPIEGVEEDGFNHLSVRSAVAIYLDRLTRTAVAAQIERPIVDNLDGVRCDPSTYEKAV